MHMRSERDLKRAIATAFAHCKHGGIALFQPDFVRETFDLSTRRGGHSENGRQVRFVETQGSRGGSRTLVDVDFEFTLTNEKGRTRVARDRHVVGLFPRATWLKMLRAAGFRVRCVTDPWKRECFVCRVP
jgi:hypothetical protein